MSSHLTALVDAVTTTPDMMSSPADDRWRLHHLAHLEVLSGTELLLACAGRCWRLRGLRPELVEWLLALTPWPQPLPLPSGSQARRLAAWLDAGGLVTRSTLGQITLVSRGYSCLRGGLSTRIPVVRGVLPQPDDLALHSGLVIVEDSEHDRVATWLLRRAGVPHVVAELGADTCRVGTFLAARGCTRCHDLKSMAQRPLLAQRMGQSGSRPEVAEWMTDWAANQIVLAVRRWRSGQDLTPGWSWLDALGQTGHQPVRPHRLCCAASQPAPLVA